MLALMIYDAVAMWICMFRDDNIDVTLAVLKYSDKIHLAALLSNL